MANQEEDQKEVKSVSHLDSGRRVILKPSSRARSWCLTLNNPSIDELSHLDSLSQKSRFWIIGQEGQDEGRTPHVQAYFSFKNQMRFSTLKNLIERGHWEKAKGDVHANYKYCSKEAPGGYDEDISSGTFKSNITPKVSREDQMARVLAKYKNVVWKPWQQQVLDIVATVPDSRTIHWIYEPTGNVGKSFLAKYLACHTGTIISSGKAADVFNQLNTTIDKEIVPKVVLCDVPRVVADYVSYQALEKLKDGLLYSGKYEGGLCCFGDVHVIAFANQRPKTDTMSLDRWKLYEVKDDQLFQQQVVGHRYV